jgi:hypothetical protein
MHPPPAASPRSRGVAAALSRSALCGMLARAYALSARRWRSLRQGGPRTRSLACALACQT